MSTRAVYTFHSVASPEGATDRNPISIYKHHDGYPSGALSFLLNASLYCTDEVKFTTCSYVDTNSYLDDEVEPITVASVRDQFVLGFMMSNGNGGHKYFTPSPEAHGDIEYAYNIYVEDFNKAEEPNYNPVIEIMSVYTGLSDKEHGDYRHYTLIAKDTLDKLYADLINGKDYETG
jgi:hypothetical protein